MRRLWLNKVCRVLLICAFNIALVYVCTSMYIPKAENNDDYILHSVLGGSFGEPSPYTGITNVLLARLICALQIAAPAINWLSVLLYALLCASLCAVGATLWLARGDAVGGLLAVAFCAFVGTPFYTLLHYTKYTILIAAAGCVTLLFGLWKQPRKLAIGTGVLLCVLASMLRLEAFVAGAAICLPVVLFALFATDIRKGFKGWLRANKRTIVGFAVMLVAVFGLYGVHRAVYAAVPEAEYYRQYLAAQQRVTDYDLAAYNDRWDAYDAIGISENDLKMIEQWSFNDNGKFTAETLSAIAAAGRTEKTTVWQRFVHGIQEYTVNRSPALFCLVMLVTAALLGDRRTILCAAGSILGYFALLFVLAATGRVTRWVCLGLLAGCCITTAWSLVSGQLRAGKRFATALGGLLCAGGLFFAHYTLERTGYVMSPAEYLAFFDAMGADSESLYIADMDTIPPIYRRLTIFQSAPVGLYNNVFELGGWNTESPAKNSILARYGVEGSPYQALIDREDVFLVDDLHFQTKADYLFENYSRTAYWSIYDTIGGHLVYAVSEAIEDTPDVDIQILEFCSEPFEADQSWLYFVFSIQTNRTPDAAYIVFEREGFAPMTYRARISESRDGVLRVSFAVPPTDVPDLGKRTARVIVITQDGAFGSAEAFSLIKETENDG